MANWGGGPGPRPSQLILWTEPENNLCSVEITYETLATTNINCTTYNICYASCSNKNLQKRRGEALAVQKVSQSIPPGFMKRIDQNDDRRLHDVIFPVS